MIDNIEKIKSLLTFGSADDFYHLQILKRKKEHPELGSNSVCIKTYYIDSIDHLDKLTSEIKSLCDFHDARAYINLNRRSYEKCAYQMLMKITGQIMNKDFRSVKNAYNSVAGTHSNEPLKRWIIDIDGGNVEHFATNVINTIKNCEPDRRKDKTIAVLPTKHGLHIITTPFNMEEFRTFHPGLDVHKDNPTILYIP